MNKVKVFSLYVESYNMTFIMEDISDMDDRHISTEVKGFYYGQPSEENDKLFYGKLKENYQ